MNIINPITGDSYNLFSTNGKNLLKKYIQLYNTFQNGGTNRLKKLSQLIKSTKSANKPDIYDNYDNYDVSEKNAKILFSIIDETWETGSYYITQFEKFTSKLRIAGLYSQSDKSKPRAPKGFVRRKLCEQLQKMVDDDVLNNESIVALEADPTVNDNLIKKVYEPMGFELKSRYKDFETGGLMSAKVEDIFKWCFVKCKNKCEAKCISKYQTEVEAEAEAEATGEEAEATVQTRIKVKPKKRQVSLSRFIHRIRSRNSNKKP